VDRLTDFLTKIAAVGGLTLIAYFAETGRDGGFIKDIWDAAKVASPFAAMFATFAWLSERGERRDAQRQCNDRTISFVEATNTQSGAIENMVAAVKQLADGFSSVSSRRGHR
jgi:hypothetical protein